MFEIHSSKLQPNKFLSLFGFKVKTRRHKVLPLTLHKITVCLVFRMDSSTVNEEDFRF